MNIIVCVDKNGGMLFNNRRQSRDREIINRILEITNGTILYIESYSEQLFPIITPNIVVIKSLKEIYNNNSYFFVERNDFRNIVKQIEKIVIYRWDKVYPTDRKFPIDLNNEWQLNSTYKFKGNSHETITEEVYVR